ncbi:protein decapping 5-like [Primulina huaijiensis]|uniref:protein decapping 5-like n=1 Tax=Primulina huaijiensis TaxID=1492673 RepID=UPI003CC75540
MAAESSTAASSNRSAGGGATADSYVGSLISLTSKSEIRYEGVLYSINTEESSIGLRNVRSFGTEGRKRDGPQVPPNDKIYEYILFRGSDIKDLQVKSSPPVPTTTTMNNDPAIIQTHYSHPTSTPTPTSLPPPIGPSSDPATHPAPIGLPGSAFQSGMPLYHPVANLNSWSPSPNENNGAPPMPTYWQGFYGSPGGLPQLPQQSLLRPPPGLSIPPSMQQMQFPNFNSSLAIPVPNLSGSTPLSDYHSSSGPSSGTSASLTSTPFPASTLSFNNPPLQPVSLASDPTMKPLQGKTSISPISTSTPNSNLPSLAPLSTPAPEIAGIPLVATKPSSTISLTSVQQLAISQPVTSIAGTSVSILSETRMPSLVTPGQLLQSGPATAVSHQTLQTVQKDVEVVQVPPKPVSELSNPVAMDSQPPLLPLPPNARGHKPNGATYHMRNNNRGRGGRGYGSSRPVTKFTEDFDFMAMNEKFEKDKVWGNLGKSNKSQSKGKEGNIGESYDDDLQEEDSTELPKIEPKPVYNKDDFFDTLSCDTLGNDPNHGRTRYSEQMRLDTETFGEFSRHQGGRRGRGPGRGGGSGGRFRGSYHGRGYGGYSYSNMGRGRGV